MSRQNLEGGRARGLIQDEVILGNVTVTLAGTLVLTAKSRALQFLDPGGSGRTVTLPAEADSDGLSFTIVNTADNAEDLTIKDDAAVTVGIIGQNEVGILLCDGTTWKSMITGTGAGLAAADITVADSGGFTATTEVEAALDEIYQHIQSIQSVIELPLMSFLDEGAGTTAVLAIFADGASSKAGFQVNESLGIRWNNAANPNPVITVFNKPPDMDTTKDAVVHILAVRSGTDASDLVTFDIIAFDGIVGAAIAADADFGAGIRTLRVVRSGAGRHGVSGACVRERSNRPCRVGAAERDISSVPCEVAELPGQPSGQGEGTRGGSG